MILRRSLIQGQTDGEPREGPLSREGLKLFGQAADNRRMEFFEALDASWSPLLLVCGVPLVVAGAVLRSVSKRRGLLWRLGNAALGLGVTLLAIAAVLHIVLPLIEETLREAFPVPGA